MKTNQNISTELLHFAIDFFMVALLFVFLYPIIQFVSYWML